MHSHARGFTIVLTLAFAILATSAGAHSSGLVAAGHPENGEPGPVIVLGVLAGAGA